LSGSIKSDPTATGGTIAPAITTLCANASGGSLTLSGYSGTIIRWESSTNGGATWTPIPNTLPTQSYSSGQTTLYRAVIQSGTCPVVYSSVALVSVIPTTTPTVAANPTTICAGQPSVLTSSSGLSTSASGVDGSFNNANPPGWRVTDNGTVIGFPANANNGSTFPWSETNGPKTPLGGATYNNLQTDGKFAITSGATTSYLETPVFSTVGMTSASLKFYEALILTAGGSAKIEISIDGGATYTDILQQYTGPVTVGVPANNWSLINLDLSKYLGQPNLRIRFNYSGASNNSNWAIDGVTFPGTETPVTYSWSASDGSTITGQTVTVTPATTTTYTLTATMGTCVLGSASVTVTVFQLPTVTTVNSCIGGGAVTFTQSGGAAAGTWTVNGGGTINASTGAFTPTTAGCFTATYKTPGPGCTDTKNFVVYPVAPVLVAPANTCNAAFTLPAVTPVTGFNVEYNIDGTGWSSSPTVPTATGCHTVQARYVLAATCGSTLANTPSTCLSNIVSVVIFPAAPTITSPSNTCNAAFTLPGVPDVNEFTVQYSIDGGATWSASPVVPSTPNCYAIQARYVLTAACGGTGAGATGSACTASNTVNVVIFPLAPLAPTVNSGCGTITVTAPPTVPGFTVQYSFDDGVTWGSNTPPTADNCTGYKIKTRYVTAANCGSIIAGTPGSGGCGESPAITRKVDNTKPTLTCPTVEPVCVVSGNTYTIPLLTASDNCSAGSALTISYSITGATTRTGTGLDASGIFNVGISTITWTVTDECGNSNTCTTQVTINPKPTPTIYHN
jgi:hypothetical protein